MLDGGLGNHPVPQAWQVGEADAQIAIRAAGQRLVEQSRFKQSGQAAKQIAALDSRIALEETRHVQRLRRRHQDSLGIILDPPEARRDHIEVSLLGSRQTQGQVIAFPPIVVVQNRDEQAAGVVAGSQQVIQAGVPRASRALGAAVAQERDMDAVGPPAAHRHFGSRRAGIVRIVHDDYAHRRLRLRRNRRQRPRDQQFGSVARGDQNRHAIKQGRVHIKPSDVGLLNGAQRCRRPSRGAIRCIAGCSRASAICRAWAGSLI